MSYLSVFALALSLLLLQVNGQCNLQDGLDFTSDGDLLTLYKVQSAAACCAACQAYEECSNFVWNKNAADPAYHQQCYLKTSRSTKSSTTNGATTGGTISKTYERPVTCTSEAGYDYQLKANLGSQGNVQDANQCCQLCQNVVGCNYWTLATNKICWFKANQGQRVASTSVIASGTVIPAGLAPVREGKRGLGVYGTTSCTDFKLLKNVSWAYNWNNNPGVLEECYDELGIEYIPMIWGANNVNDIDSTYTKSKYLLTFNEPNFREQSNLTPQQAASYWPKIEAFAAKYNMLISSPSASYGGSIAPPFNDPIVWLDTFFQVCQGCKVDFITTHQYACSKYDIYYAVKGGFAKYNKPIWLTEWACYGAANYNQAAQLVSDMDGLMDPDPLFQRYAYFGSRGDTFYSIFNPSDASLTATGVVYADPTRSGVGHN